MTSPTGHDTSSRIVSNDPSSSLLSRRPSPFSTWRIIRPPYPHSTIQRPKMIFRETPFVLTLSTPSIYTTTANSLFPPPLSLFDTRLSLAKFILILFHFMAMSGDATNWAHFYALGSHPSTTSAMFGHGPAESTVVTTAAAACSAAPAAGGGGGGCGPQMGRAGKTARRRSRASRRAPTTLLNTDTTNFRAMVQQFTGIPSGPPAHLPAGGGGGQNVGPVINFGPVFSDPARPAPTVVSFGHMQQQQQQQPYMDQFHYSRPVFTQDLYNNNNNSNSNNSNNNNNNTSSKNDHDVYLHGYGGSVSSSNSHAEMSEGFIFDGVHDHMMLPKTTTSTNSRVDGYFS